MAITQFDMDVKAGFPHPGASNVQYCDGCSIKHIATNDPITYDEFEQNILMLGWKRIVEDRIDFWYCPECSNEKV